MAGLERDLRSRWMQTTLNQRVAGLVGLWVLLSAAIGGSIAAWYVQRVTLSQDAEVVSEFIRGQVDGTRLQELLETPGTQSTSALGELMRGLQMVRAIHRIKVYDRQGSIVWSDNTRILGIAPSDPNLTTALAGRMAHNLDVPRDPEHALDTELVRNQPLVEVYVPVFGRAPGRPVAVVEVYKEAGYLLARLWQARLVVWGGVLLSGCLALGCVLLIVRRSSASLQEAQRKLEADFSGLVEALGILTDLKVPYADGHVRRVQAMTVALAAEMGISGLELGTIRDAACLHDIGKMSLPDAAFAMSGPLTPADWKRIRAHPDAGAEVLAHLELLSHVRPIIRHHHERFDGFGYPARLAGKSIPLGARVLAVADAFVAMTSPRPYRALIPAPKALEEIRGQAGQQFDPAVVAALERLAERQGLAGLMEIGAVSPHPPGRA